MRRYASAKGNTSAVTLSMPRSGPASNSPMMATITPPIRAVTMDVCTALRTASRLPRPMALAMTTFAPRAMPMNRLRMSPVTGALEPTAATAAVPSDWEKLPTIMMPDALKSCSRMPVAATGSANRRTFVHMRPCSMSMPCLLCTMFLPPPAAAGSSFASEGIVVAAPNEGTAMPFCRML